MAPTVGPASTFAALCLATFGGWQFWSGQLEAPVQMEMLVEEPKAEMMLAEMMFPVQVEKPKAHDATPSTIASPSSPFSVQNGSPTATLDAKAFPSNFALASMNSSLSMCVKKPLVAHILPTPIASVSSSLVLPSAPMLRVSQVGKAKATFTSLNSTLLVREVKRPEEPLVTYFTSLAAETVPATIASPPVWRRLARIASAPVQVKSTWTLHSLKSSAPWIMAGAVFLDVVFALVCIFAVWFRRHGDSHEECIIEECIIEDGDQVEQSEDSLPCNHSVATSTLESIALSTTDEEVTTQEQPSAPSTVDNAIQKLQLQSRINAIQDHPQDNELKAQINAIVNARAQAKAPRQSESDLQHQINAIVKARTEERMQQSPAAAPKDELQGQINAIVKERKEERMLQSPAVVKARKEEVHSAVTNHLKAQINTIVTARKEHCMQSPSAKASPAGSDGDLQAEMNARLTASAEKKKHCQQSPVPAVFCSDGELKDQISSIVEAHSKSLKQQRLVDPNPSPSPAKSVSDLDLEYHAHIAVSQAKARNTPAKSPPDFVQWAAWEESEVAPCQLSFGDCGNTFETQYDEMSMFAPEVELAIPTDCGIAFDTQHEPMRLTIPEYLNIVAPEVELAIPEPKEKEEKQIHIDVPKVEPRPFDVSEIPSPTRNHAKKQRSLWGKAIADVELEQKARQGVEARRGAEVAQVHIPQTAVQGAGEVLQQEGSDEACKAPTMDEREMQAKWLRQMKEKAELAEMDRLCIDTFLDSVRKCASSRDRVRTPIKGSNLYTKHMRPIRPPGTSVDVKDSSFINLGNFLTFLETQGLLRLKPGLSDPMVSEIQFDACRKYKYDSQAQQQFMSAMKEAQEAPHEAGCSCRLCVPSIIGRQSL